MKSIFFFIIILPFLSAACPSIERALSWMNEQENCYCMKRA